MQNSRDGACLINHSGKLKHKVFANTTTGFVQLLDWLAKQSSERVHACLEATGTYGESLALFLHQAGHVVSVVNPAAVKAFAGSRLSRTKTDRVDAELIARFCLAQAPLAWTPLTAEVRELQALVRRLESLVEMRVAEENRLEAGIIVEAVTASVEEVITHLSMQIKHTQLLIRTHIKDHPRLKAQSALLSSIPGIAQTTAATILAEIVDITHYKSARACRGLRRVSATRTHVGKFSSWAHKVIEDRQCTAQTCAVLSGDHGTAV